MLVLAARNLRFLLSFLHTFVQAYFFQGACNRLNQQAFRSLLYNTSYTDKLDYVNEFFNKIKCVLITCVFLGQLKSLE